METIKMYWGKNEILNVDDSQAEGYKRVTTSKGSFDVPQWELDAVASKEPGDETDERNARANVVAKEILEVLKRLDVRTDEVSFYMQKVATSCEINERIATLSAYGYKVETLQDIALLEKEIRFSKLNELMKK